MEENREPITLDTLAAMIKAGFDDVDAKFVEVHEKIEAVDTSLRTELGALKKEVRDGFVGVNHRLADIGDKLEDHENRITKIEHDLAP